MEKAKLLVGVTKKKEIVAQLQFQDGKKMPAPQVKLKDTALDGIDVEVERKMGRVVLIKVDNEVLFSTHTPKRPDPPGPAISPESDDPSKHPVERSHKPAASEPDRSDRHVSHVRNPAYAPYNFVPLNEKVVEINPTIPPLKLNTYDSQRNTGWVEIDIEAITPLYIRGTLTKAEVAERLDSKNKPDFCASVKRIRIPGSSLRGMTRNMMEMVSFGKFSFFEDRRLYYRGLADRSSLREEYQRSMSSFDRQSRRTRYNFSAGVLRKSEKKEKRPAFRDQIFRQQLHAGF